MDHEIGCSAHQYNKSSCLLLQLDQKHKLNKVLLSAIGDIIITYVNPPVQKWLGFSLKDLLKQPLSLFLVNLQNTDMSAIHWLYNALKKEKIIVRPLIGLDLVTSALIVDMKMAVM